MTENCQLPPLLCIEPSPRGSPTEQISTPLSPGKPANSLWGKAYQAQEAFEGSQVLSLAGLLDLIAPKQSNRKAPLQQLCDNKHKGNFVAGEPDKKREKHRIAEGKRRKNLSQLLRELDSRIHDFFLERAGWVSSRKHPESKEHIAQGAIFLIDFMRLTIISLIQQENEIPGQLSERLQSQVRCIQLQQELQAVKQKNQVLEERNRELQLWTYKRKLCSQIPILPRSGGNMCRDSCASSAMGSTP